LFADGRVTVQSASQEIGTGIRTVAAQVAAERLGLDLGAVEVEMGDTALPPAPVSGGSNSTASVSSAVIQACKALEERLRRAAVTANDSPLAGRHMETVEVHGGMVVGHDGAAVPLTQVMAMTGTGVLEEYAEFVPAGAREDGAARLYGGQIVMRGGSKGPQVSFALGAEFAEVRVHRRTCEIRVPRMVGAFTAGRIMNPRTARSQLMGGMIWGVGCALHEATEIDRRVARYVNRDLKDYLVPVNADVGELEVLLLPEEDNEVNPAGVKGLGELGNVGTAAAIANAVYHATGRRVRDLPIRVDSLLAA
ncbi:MAG TPA: molybdopterin cofactor-binding domain-containing protein, partial [Alphaproteobacteria bacterium]|nr:molybdopterin cofactor-binding domain-containing protein [Alphaproteobacteria bacterium]